MYHVPFAIYYLFLECKDSSDECHRKGSVWDEKAQGQCIKMKCTLKDGIYSADPIEQSKSYSVIIDMKEKLEDTKRVIRSRKSKKNSQHNCYKKKDKRTNNDLQNFTQKTNDQAIRIPLKVGDELRCSKRVGSSFFTCDSRRVTLITNPVINHE